MEQVFIQILLDIDLYLHGHVQSTDTNSKIIKDNTSRDIRREVYLENGRGLYLDTDFIYIYRNVNYVQRCSDWNFIKNIENFFPVIDEVEFLNVKTR